MVLGALEGRLALAVRAAAVSEQGTGREGPGKPHHDLISPDHRLEDVGVSPGLLAVDEAEAEGLAAGRAVPLGNLQRLIEDQPEGPFVDRRQVLQLRTRTGCSSWPG